MKNKIILIISLLVVVVLAIIIFLKASEDTNTDIVISPEFGEFQVSVTTTGELQAKNSTNIQGPTNARMARVWNMKITDLVEEGTVVKAGDYVGELDKSELTNNIQESQINLQKMESQLTQAQLDSSLTLSQAREDIINLNYNLEQRQLANEQSQFEPPAIQRQTEIELEKAERSLAQAKKNYETKVQKAIETIKVVEADLEKQRTRHDIYEEVLSEFTILAPENGMVIYAKEWNGKKKIVGSSISPWDPVVATLPDLSVMESLTYVNEVDIQKIQSGQEVFITLDADPNKKLTGSITHVANIGEQQPNSDSKVFEVKIEINESDSTLRPSMTTGNTIIVSTVDSVMFIPLECIHNHDTLTVVYKKSGIGVVKQQVKSGLINENNAVIETGLSIDDLIYISTPENEQNIELILLDEQ